MEEINEKIEQLYMPSNWVVRIPVEQSVPEHVRITSEESQRVRSSVDGRLGVKFGSEGGDIVDLFNEDCKTKQMVVYLSGGYWQELSGDISSYTVKPLVHAGHCVAVVHYDRAPSQDMAGITNQIERAGSWLVKYAKQKGLSLWLSGHSAGSHLCAMLLSSGWYEGLPQACRQVIKGVFHLSGVFNLAPLLCTSVNTPLRMTQLEAENFSPLSSANLDRLSSSGSHLKHVVVVGEHDSPAFKQQAEDYADQLRLRGCQVVNWVQKSEDHFSLVERLSQEDYSLTDQMITMISQ